jgi:hypothetical protein
MNNVSKSMILILIGLMTGLAAMPLHASDRSIRCGGHLIHGGSGKDSAGMYEVLKKCGEPEAKLGNTWIYIQSSMRRILTFRADGRLQRIESVRN